ncbi:MAG: DUF1836 domain-containing protein [Ruminococcaceae bacterium]|nr:DUF1836 domain-containing protein [Oscillospiraceae bacterium]
MGYSSHNAADKLRRWEKYLREYQLPDWEDIPNIGLYMEQVLSLLTEYLDYLPPELKGEQFITAATVNNYVRNRFMPRPRNKRYYRTHIAYLIIICTLKQRLNIATIHRMIPIDIPEEQVKEIYTAYVAQHSAAAKYFIEQVRVIAAPILGYDDVNPEISTDSASGLISISAIMSCLSGLLAEKLLYLDDIYQPEDTDGQQ